MLSFIKNIFGKKEEIKEVNPEDEYTHKNFYGCIATINPLTVDEDTYLSSDNVLENIYPNMEFIFFKLHKIREYVAGRLCTHAGLPNIYFYGVAVQPTGRRLTAQMITHAEDDFLFHFDDFNHDDVKIAIIDNLTSDEMVKGIKPGIDTVDDLNQVLAMGYNNVRMMKLKYKYEGRIKDGELGKHMSDDDIRKFIDSVSNEFGDITFMNIFDANYKSDDDQWFNKFLQELGQMIMDKQGIVRPSEEDIERENRGPALLEQVEDAEFKEINE